MGDWIVDNLQSALNEWSKRFGEIIDMLVASPETLRSGGFWDIATSIHNGLQATGFALLVLFFLIGMVKTTTSFTEIKRPETAFKLFLRFAIAKSVVTYGLDLLMVIVRIGQSIVMNIYGRFNASSFGEIILPEEVAAAIRGLNFFESIPVLPFALIGVIAITIISFILIMTVYGRIFTLFTYIALSPIPLASFAGEGTSAIGNQFVKSFMGVALQGAVIMLACVLHSVLVSTVPAWAHDPNASANVVVYTYIVQTCFSLVILLMAVKSSNIAVKEMFGI